ncbi:MAG: creatininase family protein [Planctomycetota bacterium]
MTRRWDEMRTDEFAAVDPETWIALLPVAAVEQHGPHLPTGTDTMIVEGVVDRLAADDRVVVLPTQSVGHSVEHTDFKGTLHQEAETLLASWSALGAAARAAGFRKLAIVNSHGGQPQLVDLVAGRLRVHHAMLVARVELFLLGAPEGLFGDDEIEFGFHGGELETSMILALRPDLVRTDALADFENAARWMARDHVELGAEAPVGFAWQAQDLHPSGATGNAAAADAERGAALLDHLAARVDALLEDLRAFPLERLRERPR